MAPPSKISQLPESLIEALDARLKASDYHDIDGHHAWLVSEIENRGIELNEPISRSAVGRRSRMLKSQNMTIQETVREMRAFEAEFGNDPLAFVQSGNNTAQMLAWKRVQAAKNGDVDVDEDFLKDISLSLSRMAKTAFINDERVRKIQDDERQRAKEAAAEKAGNVAAQAGVSPETVERIRRDVLGMG